MEEGETKNGSSKLIDCAVNHSVAIALSGKARPKMSYK